MNKIFIADDKKCFRERKLDDEEKRNVRSSDQCVCVSACVRI